MNRPLLVLWVLLPLAFSPAQSREPIIISGSGKGSSVNIANLSASAQLCVSQTNAYRKSLGLNKLKENAELKATAQGFADYMARTTTYGHTADGREPAERAAEQGYAYALVLENIAYAHRTSGYKTKELAMHFVEGWKNSPSHHEAIVHPHTLETGVAIAQSKVNGYYYAVQLFGRPASTEFRFEVINKAPRGFAYKLRTKDLPDSEQTIEIGVRNIRYHTAYFPTELQFPWMDRSSWIQARADRTYTLMQFQNEFIVQELPTKKK